MTRWIRFGTLIVSGLCMLLITSFVARTRARAEAGVAILDVDTDRRIGAIDRNIYGHFLEHINHSVEDGLFADRSAAAASKARTTRRTGRPSALPVRLHPSTCRSKKE